MKSDSTGEKSGWKEGLKRSLRIKVDGNFSLVQNEMRPGISNDLLSIEIRLNNPARRTQDEKIKNENVSTIYCVSRLLYT